MFWRLQYVGQWYTQYETPALFFLEEGVRCEAALYLPGGELTSSLGKK